MFFFIPERKKYVQHVQKQFECRYFRIMIQGKHFLNLDFQIKHFSPRIFRDLNGPEFEVGMTVFIWKSVFGRNLRFSMTLAANKMHGIKASGMIYLASIRKHKKKLHHSILEKYKIWMKSEEKWQRPNIKGHELT